MPERAGRRGRQDIYLAGAGGQFHLNAAQIRKDLANFGEFGCARLGYYVKDLRSHLRRSSASTPHRVAIMGAGNLGLAWRTITDSARRASRSPPLRHRREKIGQRSRGGVPILDVRTFRRAVRRERIAIAVIAVPAPSAAAVLKDVVDAGIKAVLNFSPGALKVPPDVKVKSVDLTVSLESLSFFLAHGQPDGE